MKAISVASLFPHCQILNLYSAVQNFHKWAFLSMKSAWGIVTKNGTRQTFLKENLWVLYMTIKCIFAFYEIFVVMICWIIEKNVCRLLFKELMRSPTSSNKNTDIETQKQSQKRNSLITFTLLLEFFVLSKWEQ